jgi:hypothetical protein
LANPALAEAARTTWRPPWRGSARSRRSESSEVDREALSRTLGRIDGSSWGGEADLTVTLENLRQITDNLRDLTEDAKRYPGN